MSFVTKIDYSNNRQVKQYESTNTQLSGSTDFGVHYSGLTGGVLNSSITTTSTLINIVSTFSGNSDTTNITFGDSRMGSGAITLVAITDSTSGDTQNGFGFQGIGPYLIDGNTIYSAYTGSSYDFTVTSIEEVGVQEWTGETISNNILILSGESADFTDRTIWVDVLGITRTKRLILADKPDSLTGVTTVLTRDELGDIYEVEFSAITTDNFITGATFSATTGELIITTVSGDSITTNLDGRYLPLSATTGDDYTTGTTFNSSSGIIEFTRLSGGTYNTDLGFTSGDTSNWDIAYDDSITGITVTGTVSKTITLQQKDGSTLTANFTDNAGGGSGDVVTGMTFNTLNGDLELRTLSGSTITENLDDRYSLTGHTHIGLSDDYLTGGTFNVSTGDLDLNLQSGSTVTINLDDRYLTGFTETPNTDDYLTGGTFNVSTGDLDLNLQSGSTVSINLDDRYLTGFTETPNTDDYLTGGTFNELTGDLDLNLQSGSTVTINLDDRYLTGFTETPNTDDYLSGVTFNTTNGDLTLTRVSGGTIVENLDGRYLTGFTESPNTDDYLTDHTFNTSNGLFESTLQSGSTVSVNLDGRYLPLSATTDDDYTTGTTFNANTGELEFTRLSGDTYSVNLDDRYSLTGHTHIGLSDDYLTGGTFNTSTGDLDLNLQSGSTVTINLDDRYLTGFTETPNTDDYITGHTFNTSTGLFESTLQSGGTVSVNLDGRYLTGFTETVESVINPLNSYFGNRVKPVSDNEGFYVESSNNKATGYLVNNTDTVGNAAISGYRATVNGDAFNEGVYIGIPNDSYFAPWLRAHGLITGKNLNIMVGDNTGDIVFSLGNTATNQITEGQQDKVLLLNTDRTIVVPSLTTTLISNETTGRVLITREYLTDNYTASSGDTINTDDYITGTTFNVSTGDLTLTRLSGGTIVENLDGRYSLTGHTHIGLSDDYTTGATFNTSDGIIEFTRLSGDTYNVDLDGRYLTISASTILNTDDYLTGGTFNELTGDLDLNLLSGSTVTINLDDRYALTGHTHIGLSDDYLTDHTFNTSNGLFESTLQSGGTVSVNLDGRYLPLSATTGDDYTTGTTFNPSSGIIEFTRLSGGTYNTDLGFTSGDTSNWDTAYNDSITGMTVTGSATKTITLQQKDGSTLTANFTDSTGGVGGSGDVVTGMTFNTLNGELTLRTLSGDTITEDLDGRYLTGFTETPNTDDYLVSGDFDELTGDLDLNLLSGSTVTINLDDRYSLTGHTHIGLSDDYLTGGTFNELTGDLDLNLQSGSTVTINLDDRYLTGFTETPNTDDYLTGGTFNVSTGDLDLNLQSGSTVTINLDDRYSLTGHTHTISEITDYIPTDDYTTGTTFNTNTGELEFTRLSGNTYSVNLDDRYSLTGHTHIGLSDDYLTGHTFNTSTGLFESTLQSGSTVSVNLDGRYSLTGHTHVGLSDDYLTGGTFNTSTGELDLNLLSGSTVTINLDDRYSLTGHTHEISDITDFTDNSTNWDIAYDNSITGATFNTGDGVLTLHDVGDDNNITVDLDGRYLTGFTETPNTDDYLTSGTFNELTGDLDLNLQSGSTVSINLDDRYSLTGHTHIGLSDDYLVSGDFDVNTGDLDLNLQSGSTVTINLDDRYSLTGHTHIGLSDDYLVSGDFDVNTGNLDLNLQSGSTVTINLDDRYLTGFTETPNTDDYLVSGDFNELTGNLDLNLLSGSTVSINLDDRYSLTGHTHIGLSDDYLTGGTFNELTGDLDLNLQSGSTVTINLDDRYALTGHTHIGLSDDYVSNSDFNTTNGDLTLTRVSGGTIVENLDGRYSLTGHTHDFNEITNTGHTHTISEITDYIPTDDYVSNGDFNTGTGEVTLTRLSGGTVVYDLDGRYSLTGHTHIGLSDDYLITHTFNTSTGLFESTLQSGSTVSVNLDGRYSLTGHTHIGLSDDYLVSGDFDVNTGDLDLNLQSGSTVTINLDDRYSLTGHTHTISEITDYIPTDDYTTGTTFNTNTGELEFTRLSGSTYSVNLDDRYSLTGHTHIGLSDDYITSGNFNTANGEVTLTRVSGGTVVYDLDGRYLNTSAYTDTFVTGFTYNGLTNTFDIERNEDLPDLSVTLTTVSGLTVNGDITVTGTGIFNEVVAVNVSATTINPVDFIQFNTGYTGNTIVEGRIYWDEDNGTLSLGMHGSNVQQQIGEELFYYVKNQSGATIENGRVVYAAGTLGSSGKILGEYMIADGTIPVKYTLGIATEDIINGDDGYVTDFGLVRGINATGAPYGETWNDGDLLWVSPTIVGGLTNIEPISPNLKIELAIVIHNDANGSVFVRPHRYPHFYDLQETTWSGGSESNLDIIQWDSTLSGWTITNTPSFISISATSISGDTIYSGDTNLTEIFSTTGHTHIGLSDDYLTGHTFNTSTGLFESTLQSGSTVSVNLDGRYSLTGHTHDFNEITNTGHTHTISEITDYIPTDDYLTGGTFNELTGDLDLNLLSGSTVSINLDDRYSLTGHTHNMISKTIDIYPTDLIGSGSTKDQVIQYINALSHVKTDDNSDLWFKVIPNYMLDFGSEGDFTGSPMALSMSSDGTILYLGLHNSNCTQYILSTPWDVTTATLTASTATLGQGGGLHVSPDGLHITYTNGDVTDGTVEIYSMSTPHDLSSLTLVSTTAFTQNLFRNELFMTDDGLNLYTSTGSNVRRYTLATPYNFSGVILSDSWNFNTTHGFTFSNDLKTFFVFQSGENLRQYNLTVAGDLTPVTLGNYSAEVDFDFVSGNFLKCQISPNGKRFVVTTYLSAPDVFSFGLSTADNIGAIIEATNADIVIYSDYYRLKNYPLGLISGVTSNDIDEITQIKNNDVTTLINLEEISRNDYVTDGSFNPANGEVTLTRLSGGTIVYDLDGRYSLTGHTHTISEITDYIPTDDYLTSGTFNELTGDLDLNLLSGSTVSINLDDRYSLNDHTHIGLSDDYLITHTFNTSTGLFESTLQSGSTVSVNLDGRYSLTGHTHTISEITDYIPTDDYVSSGSFNTSNGEVTLTRLSGGTIVYDLDGRYSLDDHTHIGLSDDYLVSGDFDVNTGDLDLNLKSGSTVTINLDDRYSLTGHTHIGLSDDYLTTHTFNTSTGLFESTLQSGSTVSVNLDGRYSLTTHTHIGLSDDYLTSGTFNELTGDLDLNLLSGSTVTINLDDRYLTDSTLQSVYEASTPSTITTDATRGSLKLKRGVGASVYPLEIQNSAGNSNFIVRDDGYFSGNGDMFVLGNITAQNSLITTSVSGFGANITTLFINGGAGDLTRGGGIGFKNNDGSIFGANYILNNKFRMGTVTAHDWEFVRTNVAVGGIDTNGLYLTGNIRASGATLSSLSTQNDELITLMIDGSGVVGTRELGTGAFVASGASNTDNYVISGDFNPANGEVTLTRLSGGTVVYDLDGRYSLTGHTHDFNEITNTGHTHTISEITDYVPTDDYLTSGTFNELTGDLDLNLLSGSTVSINLDDRYSLTGHTHTISEITDYIPTDDYLVSGTFNELTGDLDLNLQSGSTVSINLDDRYLTGFTEIVESVINPLDSYFGNRVKPVSDNEGFYVESALNKATGYLVNNTDTVGNAALSGFRAVINNDAFGKGIYVGVQNSNYYAPWLRERGHINGNAINITTGDNTGDIVFSLGNTASDNITEAAQDKVLLLNTDRTIVVPSLTTTLISNETTGRVLITREYLTDNYTANSGIDGVYLPLSGGTLTGPVTGTTFNVSNALLDYQENVNVDTGSPKVIGIISKLSYDAVFFDYVVKNGSNLRAGIVMAVHDGTSVTYTDTSTSDLGDTSGVSFTVDISGNDLRLNATVTTDNWIIKALIRGI